MQWEATKCKPLQLERWFIFWQFLANFNIMVMMMMMTFENKVFLRHSIITLSLMCILYVYFVFMYHILFSFISQIISTSRILQFIHLYNFVIIINNNNNWKCAWIYLFHRFIEFVYKRDVNWIFEYVLLSLFIFKESLLFFVFKKKKIFNPHLI